MKFSEKEIEILSKPVTDAEFDEKDGSYSDDAMGKAERHFDAILSMMIVGFDAGYKASVSDLDIYDEFVQWQCESV